jgi:hypothetical protein
MVVVRSGGRWERAQGIQLPANSRAFDPASQMFALSCPSAASCTGVGNYLYNGQDNKQGFVAVSVHGRWTPARTVRAPVNSIEPVEDTLEAVSCPRPEWCVAGGNYADKAVNHLPMIVTESHGHWARARSISSPANAAPEPFALIQALSCPQVGYCVAVGNYEDRAGDILPMVATETRGRWQRAFDIRLPAGAVSQPYAVLDGVSCPRAGSCVAVGEYSGPGIVYGMAVTEHDGRWRRAVQIARPARIKNSGGTELTAVSCTGPGSCTAAGLDLERNSDTRAITVSERAGRWHPAIWIQLPATGSGPQYSELNAVSCLTAAGCVAVGDYGSGKMMGVAGG